MAAAVVNQAKDYRGGIGAYKDFAATKYSKEEELNGSKDAAPASYPHYLPIWDKETK